MHLDLDGNGALYQQLYRALKRAILEGRLRVGARLPATRELSSEIRLARNTVLTAYELLCAECLAVSREGSGTYVADGVQAPAKARTTATVPAQSEYAKRLRRLPPIAIRRFESPVRYDLRYGEPMLDAPLLTAWRRALSAATVRSPLHYPTPNGLRELRQAICDHVVRRRGIACTAADVVIVSGAQQGISLLARVLLDTGDVAIVEDPHYQFALHALRAHGAQIVSVKTDAQGLDCAALPIGGAKLAYVTPSHQFPSGVEMSLARRMELLRYGASHDCWVVEDDYDGEFRYDAHATPALRSLDLHQRVVYIGSFSKLLFPTLRLGYVVSPPSLRADIIEAKRLADLGSPGIEQHAMAQFMASGAFDRHLRRAATELRRRRHALLSGLARHCGKRIRVIDSCAGMHMVGWLAGRSAERANKLIERAREHGLGLHPIDPYYEKPPPQPGLLLGYAALSPAQLGAATRLLGECLART